MNGFPAFEDITHRWLIKKNKEGKIDFETASIQKACPDAVDLLKKMLTADPNLRVSACEALKHPYFKSEFGEEGLKPNPNNSNIQFIKTIKRASISRAVL